MAKIATQLGSRELTRDELRTARLATSPRRTGDTLVNLLSRLGTAVDKGAQASYQMYALDRTQQSAAYRSDWIAQKIIDIPAQDGTREWRTWQADNADITAIEALERAVNAQLRMKQGMIKARLSGGAAIVIGVNDEDQSKELDPTKVKKDGLKFLHAVSRWDLRSGEVNRDLFSPFYGQPSYYTRNSVASATDLGVKIHPSRVVRLIGREIPDEALAEADGWGDSCLQVVDDAVKGAGGVIQAVSALVQEAKVDIIRMPGFTENMGTDEYEQRILRRFTLTNSSKSIINALLLDKDDEWDRISTEFGSMPDIMRMYLLISSAAADIPATRMLSQSPAGLSATGESDIRNHYDRVKSDQSTVQSPAMAVLDEVIVRSALGSRPADIFYEWVPLWQMDEVQKAAVSTSKANTFKIDLDSGLFNPDMLREARLNQLIEDGTYPGIEDAVETHGAEPDIGLEEKGIDPTTGLPRPVVADPTNSSDPAAKTRKKAVGDGLYGKRKYKSRMRRRARDAAWNEEDHPRRKDGEFAPAGNKTMTRAEMHKEAKKAGVYLNLSQHEKDAWLLEGIEREDGVPGTGAKVMRRISEQADLQGKAVVLYPDGTRAEKKVLEKYYEKFGYVKFGRYPLKSDWMDNGGMIRMPKKRKGDEQTLDAAPRTLYVCRPLLNAADVLTHFREQGVANLEDAAELHVTLAYSRTPVDWMKMGAAYYTSTDNGKTRVPPGGARLVEKLGNMIVLLFTSSELTWRWREMKEAGASWSYEDYQPHVSIARADGVEVSADLRDIEPWRGELLFGPEVFEEIKE